ncbi:MAG: DNA-3-methyladenine glycosylase [Actinomycetota bacterium]|nr:DNA-3-methyladenine glycosylase [Actinomycetota bacterium]MDP9019661.1 DNA-3-methyladenine glycosylase [Actinomycetota bacterium]
MPPLPREFYRRDPRQVAPELLHKVLVRGPCRGLIVETEAYCGPIDPASHAYRGRTRRNATMFGPPGHLYVYFTYGMHWCANAVCGDEGEGVAVLLRALRPAAGLEEMWRRRPAARREWDLCRGPARLCQALGIDGSADGDDLVTEAGGTTIVDAGVPPPEEVVRTPRIGISVATEERWRWYSGGDPNVSVGPRPGRRRA